MNTNKLHKYRGKQQKIEKHTNYSIYLPTCLFGQLHSYKGNNYTIFSCNFSISLALKENLTKQPLQLF